ncbi:hypothetical protein [Blastococcus sp. KM273128]|uniref:hypothetical protein n=1 Tax=Blastococcus sp. KM273128 TaxID=2570314 RepID=UPI001F28DE1D|nr:hypothetical protein [Blastococcus sp. KM273128]
MLALPAVFAAVPGLRRCGCCGGVVSRRMLRRLAATRGVGICAECAHFASAARHG